MAATTVANIVVPEVFENYIIERTSEKSAFVQAGIVDVDSSLNELAGGGGQTVNMPFYQDLSQARQILADSGSLTVNNITADKDIAVVHNDAQVWGVTSLAKFLSGDDPMAAIGSLIADYWARQDNKILIASLKGVFAGSSLAANKDDIGVTSGTPAATNKLTGSTFVDALDKLGDRADRLSAVAMHSSTEAALRKADLIDFIPASQGPGMLRTFQGRTVIVDDGLTTSGSGAVTKYTTYMFGPGAFVKGSANLSGQPLDGGNGSEGVEFNRDSLASTDQLINRRRHILHPRGVKFTSSSMAGKSPTDAELETAANWSLVWDAQNVPIVSFTHNN